MFYVVMGMRKGQLPRPQTQPRDKVSEGVGPAGRTQQGLGRRPGCWDHILDPASCTPRGRIFPTLTSKGDFSSRPYFAFVLVMPSDLWDYSGGLQGPYGMGGIKPWLATREANALQAVPSPRPSQGRSDWPVLKPEAPCPTQVQKWWAEMSLLR